MRANNLPSPVIAFPRSPLVNAANLSVILSMPLAIFSIALLRLLIRSSAVPPIGRISFTRLPNMLKAPLTMPRPDFITENITVNTFLILIAVSPDIAKLLAKSRNLKLKAVNCSPRIGSNTSLNAFRIGIIKLLTELYNSLNPSINAARPFDAFQI